MPHRSMSPTPTSTRARRGRPLGIAIAAAALLAGTTACSSESESTGAQDSSSNAESGAKKGQGIPEGFPKEVPLPEFEKIDVLKSGANDDIWSLMVTIDSSLKASGESLMAAYRKQLESAGFVVDEETDYSVEVEKDGWEVDFRSSLDGTLTIGASKD